MNENNVVKTSSASKWLQMMFYITLASMINSVITVIPAVPSVLTAWVSRAIMLAMIFCTYQLRIQNEHYKKAAVFRSVMLASTLAAAYVFQSTVLTLAASVFSILAVYQEYSGHAELIQQQDPKLAGKWHSLFYWGLVAGILISFGTTVTAVLAVVSGLDAGNAAAVVLAVLSIPQLIIDVVYLLYLKKMMVLLSAGAEMG